MFDLDKDQWQELKPVLEAAAHASASDRAAVLERALAHDPHLLECAQKMLQQYDTATQRFDSLGVGGPAQPTSIDESPSHAGIAIGQHVAHYRVLRKLGEGGMGIVYLAEDERLGRQVALKILSATHAATPADARTQLLAESRAAAVLNHPAIVTLLELVDTGSELVAVMEYVEGRPLSALIAEPLPLGFALRLAVQLADALAYAHGRGIVHCDLKPANIHILPSGSPKILDFGLARALAGSVHASDTQQGPLFGTPGYVAPERLLGREPAAAADVYALGVILYRLLTGTAPFPTEDQAQLFFDTVMTLPKPPSTAMAGVPAAVDDVVMRCLTKVPRERLQPHEIARALSAVLLELETSPLVAPWLSDPRDTTLGPAMVPTARRSKTAVAATIVGGALASLTLFGFITSVFFNQPLGRVGDFAVESPLLWPYWGLRSIVVVLGSVAIFTVVALALAALWQLLVPVFRRFVPASAGLRSLGIRIAGASTAGLAASLLMGQMVVLGWMRWRFDATLTGLDSFITGQYQALKFLGPAYGDEHTVLSHTLTLQAFVFGSAWFWLLNREPQHRRGVGRAYCWAGAALTVASIVVFQVVPFRILYHAEAERVRFGSEQCYLVGRYREDALLFCPQRQPPWTQIIRANDPTLQSEGAFESVFSNVD